MAPSNLKFGHKMAVVLLATWCESNYHILWTATESSLCIWWMLRYLVGHCELQEVGLDGHRLNPTQPFLYSNAVSSSGRTVNPTNGRENLVFYNGITSCNECKDSLALSLPLPAFWFYSASVVMLFCYVLVNIFFFHGYPVLKTVVDFSSSSQPRK